MIVLRYALNARGSSPIGHHAHIQHACLLPNFFPADVADPEENLGLVMLTFSVVPPPKVPGTVVEPCNSRLSVQNCACVQPSSSQG